ncbi:MAG: hypothetical protein V4489_08255 [Chlamydiota bacterium]
MSKEKKEDPKNKNVVKRLLPDVPRKLPSATSSIAPSTSVPAAPVPPDPEILTATTKPGTRQKATAVDAMVLKMAEENIETTPEVEEARKESLQKKVDGGIDSVRAYFSKKDTGPSQEDTAVLEGREDVEVAEEVKEEDDVDPNALFPGLKAIGNALGLSSKKKKKSSLEDE